MKKTYNLNVLKDIAIYAAIYIVVYNIFRVVFNYNMNKEIYFIIFIIHNITRYWRRPQND